MDAQFKDFYKQLNQSTSVFSDVMSVATQARSMANKSNNAILHSQALSMVLRHETSDVIREDAVIDEYESRYIKEVLIYVDDVDVRNAVYDSFYDSKSNKNLLFIYNDISDEPRKARVRILTRMLWHKLTSYSIRSDLTMSNETKRRGRKRKNDTEYIEQTAIIESVESIETDAVEHIDDEAITNDTETVVDSSEAYVIPDTDTVCETAVADDTEQINAAEVPEQIDATLDTPTDTPTKTRKPRSAKEKKTEVNEDAPKFKSGDKFVLPFARLFASSVSKISMRVCSGDVEILSDEIHDGRINVYNHGTNLRGWIDTTDIK